MRFLLAIILVLCLQICVHSQDDYCFGKDTERPQTRHFTSKTAYQIIKGTNMEKEYLVPGCKATKIWILHRHGTRLPTVSTIQKAPRLEILRDEIVKNYRVRRTKPDTNALCLEDLTLLSMWKWNASITIDQEQFLTPQGYEDLKGTAKTYQRFYGDVLNKNYNNSHYKFRHTDTQRTTESFKAFVEGLFGVNNTVQPEPIPEQDLLLRPYDYCESWKAHDYSGINSESYKFKHSAVWNKTIEEISKRLGFQYPLESSDVELMWDMCRYEQAWQVDRISAWCAVLTSEQVTILEYEDDMKYYYKLGYGYEENTRLNCRAAQDMLTHLNSETTPNVVAYFAHTSGVQTLLAALGIAKDNTPLTAANYNRSDYKWRTSNLDPFASNFIAVKYECNDNMPDKAIFFLNQNAVELDWCDGSLCDWPEVLKQYQSLYTADCSNFYCAGASAVSIVTSLSLLLFCTFIILRLMY
ncbi:multiple inositol polyphosphate phosphatase 1 [Bactrocera tryoni]|uniref:multiple inositol polyphosphate phosphatase 1 n=1 Tax=Bactrocera tryoni TaxID=59916 RepID=UPI001A994BD3|nr:multiple inositol polyphosphate phosphatase 1 [Bactrocera tryoni]XP_039965092.1 multiple inositol polyphosphate phosphatase 1 [Bactrocera tryoni]